MGNRRLCQLLAAAALLGCAQGGSDCLVYRTSHWGWGSNVFGLLLTLVAHPNVSTVVFDESAWGYKCSEGGSWRDFFVGSVPLTPAETPGLDACEPVFYEGCTQCGHDLLASRPVHETFPLMVAALRRVWQLTDGMQLHADIQAAYLASLPKPLIGIHIRSGDKGHEDQKAGRNPHWYREQEWVRGLQELLKGLDPQRPGTCLMFGDELHALEEAASTLKGSLDCTTMVMGGTLKGHTQADFNALNRTTACDSTRELILSLEALAKVDVFVGNFNSNVPRIVHLLRGVHGKSEATSRDLSRDAVGWHHNFASLWHGSAPASNVNVPAI